MTKVKLKDATKELLKGAEDMLGSVSTMRKSADNLAQAARKLENQFLREEEQRRAEENTEITHFNTTSFLRAVGWLRAADGGGYGLTTFCGAPARKARRFSTAAACRRTRVSFGAQAICGVKMQFGAVSRGLPGSIGSLDTTSAQ